MLISPNKGSIALEPPVDVAIVAEAVLVFEEVVEALPAALIAGGAAVVVATTVNPTVAAAHMPPSLDVSSPIQVDNKQPQAVASVPALRQVL